MLVLRVAAPTAMRPTSATPKVSSDRRSDHPRQEVDPKKIADDLGVIPPNEKRPVEPKKMPKPGEDWREVKKGVEMNDLGQRRTKEPGV